MLRAMEIGLKVFMGENKYLRCGVDALGLSRVQEVLNKSRRGNIEKGEGRSDRMSVKQKTGSGTAC